MKGSVKNTPLKANGWAPDGRAKVNTSRERRDHSCATIILSSFLVANAGLVLAGDTDDLIAAAESGDLARVEALLAADVDINAKSDSGLTALWKASFLGHLQMVRALLAAGADVDARSKHGTALDAVRQGGHLDIVRLLKKAGAKQ